MNNSGAYRIFNLVLVGLLAGTMLEEYFIVKVVFPDLSPLQWAELHAKFGTFHLPVIIPVAVLATISLIIILIKEIHLKTSSVKLTWLAAPLFLIIIIITAVFMMPLNLSIAEWNTTGLPADREHIQAKWIMLHGARTILSVVGFVILTVALFNSKPLLSNN